MDDLISRQAAIDALGDAHFRNYGNAIMVIRALPSAGPGWIPVSERLPERGDDVIVTRKFNDPKTHKSHYYVETASYIGSSWVSIYDEYKIGIDNHDDPIAWMPLPEAFRRKANGSEK